MNKPIINLVWNRVNKFYSLIQMVKMLLQTAILSNKSIPTFGSNGIANTINPLPLATTVRQLVYNLNSLTGLFGRQVKIVNEIEMLSILDRTSTKWKLFDNNNNIQCTHIDLHRSPTRYIHLLADSPSARKHLYMKQGIFLFYDDTLKGEGCNNGEQVYISLMRRIPTVDTGYSSSIALPAICNAESDYNGTRLGNLIDVVKTIPNGEYRWRKDCTLVDHIDVYDYHHGWISADESIYCRDIHDYVHQDNANYCDIDDNYYYDTARMPQSDPIRRWNAGIPLDSKFLCLKKKRNIGLEEFTATSNPLSHRLYVLEIESMFDSNADRTEFVHAMNNSSINAYCKQDGSLSDSRGCEVATAPYNFEASKKIAVDVLSIIHRYNGKCYVQGTGLHIHPNKNVTRLEFSKIAQIVCRENREYCLQLGERQISYSCLEFTNDNRLVDRHNYPNRYDAWNVRTHSYENRMFGGTDTNAGIIKAIETVESMCAWSRETPIIDIMCYGKEGGFDTIRHPNPHKALESWERYVSNHMEVYPNLYAFLATNKMLKEDHVGRNNILPSKPSRKLFLKKHIPILNLA